jgi:tetratricopeptide (TPR) repeat protein
MHTHAQTLLQKQKMAQAVFENVVNAYGNAKAAPLLIILPNTKKERVVAAYSSTPQPTIKVDEQLIDICIQLKADSLNALATIISHELAHYYNDHTFCSDYAFVLGNTTLSKVLRNTNKTNKIEKETEADYQGLWYATIAGYYPFNIFDNLIDKIYRTYKLPDAVIGYPTKIERKAINKERQEKCNKLLPIFYAGNLLTNVGEYEAAVNCYETVLNYFPSRENYNNVGVATFLNALALKPLQAIEFIYPIEIDAASRLNNNTTRSNNDNDAVKFEVLLLKAKKYFDKAIILDDAYTKAYINLSCVLDVMGNSEAAIGKLNELPLTIQNTNNVNMTKGIIYYHADNNAKAELYFNKMSLNIENTTDYNYQLYKLLDKPMMDIAAFNEDWWLKKKTNLVTQFKVLSNEKEHKSCQTIKDKILICYDQKNFIVNIEIEGKNINLKK